MIATTPLKTRLGKRLRTLYECIPEDTDCLYDLCCDHGAIGRAVLETTSQCKVVFNDIHPDIMSRLADLLHEFSAKNYQLAVCPAQNLEVTPSRKPTFLLAGIGDEQCIKIMEHLSSQPHLSNAHFIISPATKVHHVRHFLQTMNASLIRESTVTENKRTYEIIEVTFASGATTNQVDEYGLCWLENDAGHIRHLKKLVSFYGAHPTDDRGADTATQSQRISQAYAEILKKISPMG